MLIQDASTLNPDGYLDRTPRIQFALLTTLFALWAAAAALNDILITAFKSVFSLSDLATGFVQTAFYFGYFVIAIPAARLIRRFTYKTAIIIGLILYIIGCFLFIPAGHVGTYSVFLVALFVIAVGLSFLETSANTYSSMMGTKESSTRRLNISQTMYPIGSIAGILLGKYLVFGSGDSLQGKLAAATSEAQKHAIAEQSLNATLQPYKVIIVILMVILVMFIITDFPTCKPIKEDGGPQAGLGETLNYLRHDKDFVISIVTQFVYMAMQTSVWSFTTRLALELDRNLNERAASNFMLISYALFFVGRGTASWLMGKFRPAKVLQAYSVLGAICMIYVVFGPGMTSVYAATASVLFFAPCWPTIYGSALECVKEPRYKETGGAIIVMAIIGGAVGPVIQGWASDTMGSMQKSFVVSAICYVIILAYFVHMARSDKKVAVETVNSKEN